MSRHKSLLQEVLRPHHWIIFYHSPSHRREKPSAEDRTEGIFLRWCPSATEAPRFFAGAKGRTHPGNLILPPDHPPDRPSVIRGGVVLFACPGTLSLSPCSSSSLIRPVHFHHPRVLLCTERAPHVPCVSSANLHRDMGSLNETPARMYEKVHLDEGSFEKILGHIVTLSFSLIQFKKI